MKKMKLIYIAILFVALVSCSDDDQGTDDSGDFIISSQNLQGNVFGTTFLAAGGKSFASGDENQISINITNVVANCSDNISDFDLYLSAIVTAEVGQYTTNVSFHSEDEFPLNYFAGTVEVVDITETQVSVKVLAESSSENTVEGAYTIPLCK